MKVIVIGPRGKMGKLITQVAASRDDMELVGAIAPKLSLIHISEPTRH